VNSFYDIPHPDVFVHLRNATQQLASSIPEANILLSNVVSVLAESFRPRSVSIAEHLLRLASPLSTKTAVTWRWRLLACGGSGIRSKKRMADSALLTAPSPAQPSTGSGQVAGTQNQTVRLGQM